MNNRVRALESLIAVFLLGLLMGAGSALIWTRGGLPRGSWFSMGGGRNPVKFSDMLHLTPEQDAQIKAIFDETRSQGVALRREMESKFAVIRAQANSKIAALLSDEQKKIFERFLKELDAIRDLPPRGDGRENHGPPPH
jgi:Spy/CpxP family protein refolding chaperone